MIHEGGENDTVDDNLLGDGILTWITAETDTWGRHDDTTLSVTVTKFTKYKHSHVSSHLHLLNDESGSTVVTTCGARAWLGGPVAGFKLSK